MKLNCDRIAETISERDRRQREWHDWFAWFPVRVEKGDCRWMETVERRIEREYASGWGHDFVTTHKFYQAKERA